MRIKSLIWLFLVIIPFFTQCSHLSSTNNTSPKTEKELILSGLYMYYVDIGANQWFTIDNVQIIRRYEHPTYNLVDITYDLSFNDSYQSYKEKNETTTLLEYVVDHELKDVNKGDRRTVKGSFKIVKYDTGISMEEASSLAQQKARNTKPK